MCLSLSFPGVEDTFKIFQFRVFESAVLVGTSDARKNAATKVRRQQRARARREESDERRHRVKVVKAGMAKSARSKASFERERERKKQREAFFLFTVVRYVRVDIIR